MPTQSVEYIDVETNCNHLKSALKRLKISVRSDQYYLCWILNVCEGRELVDSGKSLGVTWVLGINTFEGAVPSCTSRPTRRREDYSSTFPSSFFQKHGPFGALQQRRCPCTGCQRIHEQLKSLLQGTIRQPSTRLNT